METRFAFAHEGLSGLAVILGEPRMHMVCRFQVHVYEWAPYATVRRGCASTAPSSQVKP